MSSTHEFQALAVLTAPPPVAATPVALSPLKAAWVQRWLAANSVRPRELNVCNSPAALVGRVVDIEADILIYADYLFALIEDTAQHCHLSRIEADHAKAILLDLASDLRGRLIKACEGVAA